MATKTISLSIEAYDRLRTHRRVRAESFSQVVLRAQWPDETVTAAELLELWRAEPPFLTEEECSAIEAAKSADRPPKDKWNKP